MWRLSNRKTFIRVLLFVLAAFFLFFFVSDLVSGEAGRVRRFILKGRRAVESNNLLSCADLISRDYRDKYGNDRSSLIYALKEGFAYYSRIIVNIEEMKVNIAQSGTRADVEIQALALGLPKGKAAEKILEGQNGKVRAALIKEDKEWRLLEIEFLEPVSIMGREVI